MASLAVWRRISMIAATIAITAAPQPAAAALAGLTLLRLPVNRATRWRRPAHLLVTAGNYSRRAGRGHGRLMKRRQVDEYCCGRRLRDPEPVQPAVDLRAHNVAVGRRVVEPAPQRGGQQLAGVL